MIEIDPRNLPPDVLELLNKYAEVRHGRTPKEGGIYRPPREIEARFLTEMKRTGMTVEEVTVKLVRQSVAHILRHDPKLRRAWKRKLYRRNAWSTGSRPRE